MRGPKEVEIFRRMDTQQRLKALVVGRLGAADRGNDRIDAAGMLCGRMHRAVEEFSGGPVRSLPLVPKAPHRFRV
jgi:hypothetical protein